MTFEFVGKFIKDEYVKKQKNYSTVKIESNELIVEADMEEREEREENQVPDEQEDENLFDSAIF